MVFTNQIKQLMKTEKKTENFTPQKLNSSAWSLLIIIITIFLLCICIEFQLKIFTIFFALLFSLIAYKTNLIFFHRTTLVWVCKYECD